MEAQDFTTAVITQTLHNQPLKYFTGGPQLVKPELPVLPALFWLPQKEAPPE